MSGSPNWGRYSQMSDPGAEEAMRTDEALSPAQSAIIQAGTWRNRVKSVTANFFGIGDNANEDQRRWQSRRSRHLSRRHGGVKPHVEDDLMDREVMAMGNMTPLPHIIDPLARPRMRTAMDETDGARQPLNSAMSSATGGSSVFTKQVSHRLTRQRSKRQSVAKMGWEVLRQSVRQPKTAPKQSVSQDCLVQQRPPLLHSRSFAPASLVIGDYEEEDEMDTVPFFSPGVVSDDLTDDVFFSTMSPKRERQSPVKKTQPAAAAAAAVTCDLTDEDLKLKEAVSLPTVMEAETESEGATSKKPSVKEIKGKISASLPQLPVPETPEELLAETPMPEPTPEPLQEPSPNEPIQPTPDTQEVPVVLRGRPLPSLPPERVPSAGEPLDGRVAVAIAQMIPTGIGWRKRKTEDKFRMAPILAEDAPDAIMPAIRRNKIAEKIMQGAFDNSDRRQIGKGLVGRVLNRSYKSRRMDSNVRKQIEEIEDHRPYFTYWVTTVQIVIVIVSIAFYGFAPIGFSYSQRTELVQQSNLVVQTVGYMEPDNFWIGPRPADLIHLGAKFSPCMHRDRQIHQTIDDERQKESTTGCCVRTDKSGCVQSLQEDCPTRFSNFIKWPDTTDPENDRSSGPVCGQDPRSCVKPASVPPYEWEDDISKWPICWESLEIPDKEHTTCDVTGRPCCIGIYGTCMIVSRDQCDFVNGYYHEEATLCSQVNCLDAVCGLVNFANPEYPDQIYRIFLSLFLHAGIFHCILSVIMQMTILRDLEKLAGFFRISVIYIFSGIGGNITSAIFIPYRAETGPAGAQFGLLACLVVEVLQSWQILKSPFKALAKLLFIIALLFVLGLLPWIDNYAHLGGFICGTFLSFIFLPYIYFGEFDRNRKRVQILVSIFLLLAYYCLVFTVFYLRLLKDCSWCQFFNCVPLTDDFCNDMDLRLDKIPVL
ncbi:inactive rhomboid protein 2-like isoform X2 [Acanthaster planci]|uniref:Inactive rhomboid protein 2-like isoform X2 n=1 Tax=Acanthaster planci TaxID=133434 RepID=A0A8B7XJ85_ACAPL|nr:inactive rhomboid protein 2-like isoform X2 [Acanthaster planci]XP_022080249.1 inactive rhomboid protein 2-like isoform X2 [Acanthaster planci]XP_022080251.1 inactive rhomboid protein 2-like isoform X2 [Acanthaster planci]XP_022080252.1 inactive rhomboid protein 2-like isoform X2 [Acanthaster planci]XP_022080253.1 inactive rhomboid protein 2-like isoform X2 [Acanthaster planci]XP_022080254.1 inactive rhomboid protein 2-like isoform X2 [Acanthaster planci]XP_022080255.1 inactive rhomboid pr